MAFGDIKTQLLHALRESSRDGRSFCGQPIPKSSQEVILARAVDQTDLSQGWARLEVPGEDERKKGRNNLDCPEGIGLKSADALAFKFGGPDSMEEDGSDWGVTLPSYSEEDFSDAGEK